MPQFLSPILLFLLLCYSNFSFSTDAKTKDTLSYHLQKQFNTYESTNMDSCSYYAYQLIKHFSTIGNDSLLIRSHQDFGRVFEANKQMDSSLYHYNTALRIARTQNIPFLIIRSEILIGIHYDKAFKLEKAIKHYNDAIALSHQYQFSYYEAITYNQLGNIYWEQENIHKALQAFINANTIIEKHKLSSLKISTLANIANIYTADKQWSIALIKLNEILKLAKETNNIYYQAWANNNIGTVYETLENYNKALTHYQRSLEIRKSGNITNGLSSNYHNLGSIHYRLGDYKQAIYFLNTSLSIAKESNSKVNFIYDYEFLSRVYIKTKEYTKAADFLSKAIAMANELNLIKKKVDLSKLQTEYYFETGNLHLAQQAFTKYDSLKNYVNETEKSEKIIQMQTLYETEKKEKENELLKAQNELSSLNLKKEIDRKDQVIIGLGVSLALLILIVILLRNMMIANKANKDTNIKLEESNKKLKLINSTKDKFFSIIAHDLRSPLGAILSFSNLIDEECQASKEVKAVSEYNSYLNQAARNLNSLLENLLQWAKSQLGNIKFQPITLNIANLIQSNIEIQKFKAKEKSITIISHVDDTISAYADINMINTVIRNLLSNAIKFSYPKSEINLRANIHGRMLHLSVQDKGIGISESKQKKLFNIDSNQSTLGTNNETGTGLGLILCKEFVETNGGTICITSKEGKGTTFTFTIPLKKS